MHIFIKSLLICGALVFGGYGSYRAVEIYGLTGNVTRIVTDEETKTSSVNKGDDLDKGVSSTIVDVSSSDSAINQNTPADMSDQKLAPSTSSGTNVVPTTLSPTEGDATSNPGESQEQQKTPDVNTGTDPNSTTKENVVENIPSDATRVDSSELVDTAPSEPSM